jgi:membrane protease YdiL (CAAX protease family)
MSVHDGSTLQKGRILKALGLTLKGFPDTSIRALLLTATFFLGPLVYRLAEPQTHNHICCTAHSVASAVHRIFIASGRKEPQTIKNGELRLASDREVLYVHALLIPLRNLVAAPIAEEFVFRACMLPLMELKV